jgi:hypothetical protein
MKLAPEGEEVIRPSYPLKKKMQIGTNNYFSREKNRVTRLGKFSPHGGLFTLDIYKIT